MTAALEKLEGLKRQLAVTVPANDVKKAYQKRLSEVSKQASIKGFRPGKVPPHVIEQKFGKGLMQEVASELIQSGFDAAVKAQNLKVAGSPNIDFDPAALKKDMGFDYTAKFEVYPEIELTGLDGVDIEEVKGEVAQEDISGMLIKLRTQHTEWELVDRAAKLGDRLKLDFDGIMDGKPLEGGSAKDTPLELGSKSMIPGFEDGLIGAKKGEEKLLKIAFPEDYHVADLKGKPVEFTVTVNSVEAPKLPELDDAFAKKLGVEGGVDALKESVKEKMQTELDGAAKMALKQQVLDKLMELNPVDVPMPLIDVEIKSLQEMTRREMQYVRQDMTEDQIKKIPFSREPFVEEAKKRVLLGLLLAEVIKAHEIKVDQDQVKAKVAEIASAYPNVDEVISMYTQNKQMRAEVEAFVLEEQAIKTLLSKANLIKTEKSYDAIMNAGKKED